jgi:predicted PhzF superfamily epimerase YddE/YHI9
MALEPQSPIYQVDVFMDIPFHGSPTTVFLPVEPLDPWAMQLIAREMNLSGHLGRTTEPGDSPGD